MNAQTITAIIMAGVMVFGMLGSLLALTFKLGALSGQMMSSMQIAQRDHGEVLAQLGKIEGQIERHIETHGKVSV